MENAPLFPGDYPPDTRINIAPPQPPRNQDNKWEFHFWLIVLTAIWLALFIYVPITIHNINTQNRAADQIVAHAYHVECIVTPILSGSTYLTQVTWPRLDRATDQYVTKSYIFDIDVSATRSKYEICYISDEDGLDPQVYFDISELYAKDSITLLIVILVLLVLTGLMLPCFHCYACAAAGGRMENIN